MFHVDDLVLWTDSTKRHHTSGRPERNLNTQRGFMQEVKDMIFQLHLDFGGQQFLLPRNLVESRIFFAIHRVFADGSRTVDCLNGSAGVFCDIFSFYSHISFHMPAFNVEIFQNRLGLSQLLCRKQHFSKVVILFDSRAVL